MSPSPIRPPQLAVWLVELFVPDEQVQSVLGDLFEEFCDVASKSGLAHARRWYWRQTLPTILHLLGNGLRTAPWFMAGVVAGGIVLVELGRLFTGWFVHEGFLFLDLHVFPYSHPHSRFEIFLVVLLANSWTQLCRLTVSMLIGCIVALMSKGKEMSATLALSVVCSIPALTRFLLFSHGNHEALRHWLVWPYFFGGLFALVAGNAIIKSHRLRSLRARCS